MTLTRCGQAPEPRSGDPAAHPQERDARPNPSVNRPRRGLPFEDALRRWSSPEEYDRVEALFHPRFDVPIIASGGPPDPQEEAYRRGRRELERTLLDRLAAEELLSSATEETPDPKDPRFLVHPSVYDEPGISWSRWGGVLIGRSVELWRVEIFEPDAVPSNVTGVPDWAKKLVAKPPATPGASENDVSDPGPEPAGFTHDAGYAHVTINGIEFTLNPIQAGIVRVLHVAARDGRRWVSVEELRQEVGFEHAKLSGVFRHMKDPHWRTLIASDRRGAYRLNL